MKKERRPRSAAALALQAGQFQPKRINSRYRRHERNVPAIYTLSEYN
jgi:hypothetical protein